MFILFSYMFHQKFASKSSFCRLPFQLSLPVFLEWFLILSNFSLMLPIDMFLIKELYRYNVCYSVTLLFSFMIKYVISAHLNIQSFDYQVKLHFGA